MNGSGDSSSCTSGDIKASAGLTGGAGGGAVVVESNEDGGGSLHIIEDGEITSCNLRVQGNDSTTFAGGGVRAEKEASGGPIGSGGVDSDVVVGKGASSAGDKSEDAGEEVRL